MSGIRVGDVVTLTVSDKYGRVLPPWPYRLQGFEFRVVEKRIGMNFEFRACETIVSRGRFTPLQNADGSFTHEWANKSLSERTLVEIDAPWPVAVKRADETAAAIEDEFGAVGSVSKNEGSST